MKNYLYLVGLSVLALGCKSNEDQKKDELTNVIRHHYEDTSFKQNKTVELLEIKVVDYQILNQLYVDSLRSVKYKAQYEGYKFVGESNSSPSIAFAYNDTARMYLEKDSLLRIEMADKSIGDKDVYYAKYFCKSRIGGQNTLDTLYMYLDDKLKPIVYDL